MGRKLAKLSITVKPEYFIMLALGLLIIPFQWIIAWITASTFHEFFHFFALRLSGSRIFEVQVGLNGTVMDTDLFGDLKEILCALAGPIGSFLLILIGRWCPRLAICGFFQCAYNLIPIYPLDGGRVIRSIMRNFFSDPKSLQIEMWLENSVLLLFLLLGLYAFFCLKLGLIPLIFAVILMMKNKQGKCTCKE